VCWRYFPNDVKRPLKLEIFDDRKYLSSPQLLADACSLVVPLDFAQWWFRWTEIASMEFPIPAPLEYFGSEQLKRNLDREIKWQVESMLSKAITTAWDVVPAAWRDLILFCWGGARSNGPCNPWLARVSNEEAREILSADLRGQFWELEAMAGELYNSHVGPLKRNKVTGL